MEPYYELHITINDGDKDKLKQRIEHFGWSFSAIEDDIILGKGVKSYATKHLPGRTPKNGVLDELHGTASSLFDDGFDIIRRKVELVLFDNRTRMSAITAAK